MGFRGGHCGAWQQWTPGVTTWWPEHWHFWPSEMDKFIVTGTTPWAPSEGRLVAQLHNATVTRARMSLRLIWAMCRLRDDLISGQNEVVRSIHPR